jgi:hypothetical protein
MYNKYAALARYPSEQVSIPIEPEVATFRETNY